MRLDIGIKNFFFVLYFISHMLGVNFTSSALSQSESQRIDLLTKALEAQDQGRDEDAIQIYNQVIKQGFVNGHLYYNLGISYYKSSRIGEAMAAFLAARRYLPRNADVRANLKFVQGKIKDKLEAEKSLGIFAKIYPLTDWFTKREISYLTLLVTLFISLITTFGIYFEKYKKMAVYGWFGFAIPCILCLFLMLKWVADPRWGAIKSQDGAKVFSGPGDTYTLLFSLQVGAPVYLGGQVRQNYLPIEISDGKKGWVALDHVAFFGE